MHLENKKETNYKTEMLCHIKYKYPVMITQNVTAITMSGITVFNI